MKARIYYYAEEIIELIFKHFEIKIVDVINSRTNTIIYYFAFDKSRFPISFELFNELKHYGISQETIKI